jgi:hypothetical protein
MYNIVKQISNCLQILSFQYNAMKDKQVEEDKIHQLIWS